ncbi:TIGR04086 family membrane protein [Nesterenkonia sp. CF4.4]|uniref:TIGR04086 family membrane protein n=1 Tax=Nesterenkonia sp. CF4.4 TaxID=3373079 RepID=UPI003EE72B06
MARPNDPHGNDRILHDTAAAGGNPQQPGNVRGSQTTGKSQKTREAETGDRPTRTEDIGPQTTQNRDDHSAKDSFIGTDLGERGNNASWGAIFAGTVTFLAVMLVFGLISAAMGLSETDGVAIGIWSIIAILLALAIAGFVAGALAVRSGLLHGLVTWATSLVAVVVLIGWLGTSVLGAVGGAIGDAAEAAGGPAVVQQEVERAEDEVDEATQEARDTAEGAQDDVAAGTWWGVAGLVVGALVAAFAGAAGAKSAHTRRVEVDTAVRRR